MLHMNDTIRGRAQELPFILRMLLPIFLHFIDFYTALNIKDFLEASSVLNRNDSRGKLTLVTICGVKVVRCPAAAELYQVSDSTGESLMTLHYMGQRNFMAEFGLKTFEQFCEFFVREISFRTLTFSFSPRSRFPEMLFANVHVRKKRSKQEAFTPKPAVLGMG